MLTAAALRAWPDRPLRHGRSRRCVATPPTSARSPKPLPKRMSSATCRTSTPSGGDRQGKLDLPTYPFQHREYRIHEQPVRPERQRKAQSKDSLPRDPLGKPLVGPRAPRMQTPERSCLAHHRRRRRGTSAVGRRADSAGTGTAFSGCRCLTRTGSGSKSRCVPLRRTNRRSVSFMSRPSTGQSAIDESLLRMQHRVLRRNAATLPLRCRRRTALTHLDGDPRRQASHRHGHRVTGSDVPVGFGRAASLEHPRLWGGLADLAGRDHRRVVAIDRSADGGTV